MSQRDQIRMTDEEITTFLVSGGALAVASINPDGAPHLVAMWYALIEGKIAFWTYARSQKAVNLRRDPRLACMIETGVDYTELRGVQVNGHATLIEETPAVTAIATAIYRRNTTPELSPEQLQMIAAQAPKRIAVIVEPDVIVSWDHTKLSFAR